MITNKGKVQPLPCPFCGTKDIEVVPWHGGPKTKRLVGCNNDYCHAAPSVTGRTRSVAVRLWNTRA